MISVFTIINGHDELWHDWLPESTSVTVSLDSMPFVSNHRYAYTHVAISDKTMCSAKRFQRQITSLHCHVAYVIDTRRRRGMWRG